MRLFNVAEAHLVFNISHFDLNKQIPRILIMRNLLVETSKATSC